MNYSEIVKELGPIKVGLYECLKNKSPEIAEKLMLEDAVNKHVLYSSSSQSANLFVQRALALYKQQLPIEASLEYSIQKLGEEGSFSMQIDSFSNMLDELFDKNSENYLGTLSEKEQQMFFKYLIDKVEKNIKTKKDKTEMKRFRFHDDKLELNLSFE